MQIVDSITVEGEVFTDVNLPSRFHRDPHDESPTSWMATLESKDAFYVLGFPDGRFAFVIQDGDISVFESRHLLHFVVLNVGNPQRYYSTFYTDAELWRHPKSSKDPPGWENK